MTENEANTKWCSFARTVEMSPGGPSFPRNRVARPHDNPPAYFISNMSGCTCIGSGCMAWRWAVDADDSPGHSLRDPEGYCGLAGRP